MAGGVEKEIVRHIHPILSITGMGKLKDIQARIIAIFLVTAQAETFAVENSAKKVCMWGVRPTCTSFLRNLLPRLSSNYFRKDKIALIVLL